MVCAVELALNDQLFGGKGKGFAALKRPLLNLDNAVQRQAAWIDEDDEDVTVDLENTSRLRKLRKTGEETHVQGDVFQQRLKKQFESGRSAASWADIDAIDAKKRAGRRADLSDGESDDEEFDLFATSGSLMERSHDVLLPGTLEVGRVKDANQHGQSNAVVQSVQFHPNGQLLLTAGLDKALRLFQIDGSTNSKIESIFLKDMPISCAKFTADGKRIVMSGPRTYIHSYDMEAGTVQRIPRVG
ncbi:hypothetical protein DYB34_011431, partial [Aphanomyces astaci]